MIINTLKNTPEINTVKNNILQVKKKQDVKNRTHYYLEILSN